MNEFYIARYVKDLIMEEESIIVNINNKYKEIKNKILDSSYKLLEDIYYINMLDINKRLFNQKRLLVDIKMLDFCYYKLYISKEINDNTYKIISKKLISLTKMIYGWIKYGSKY
jgi:hypothetical protein